MSEPFSFSTANFSHFKWNLGYRGGRNIRFIAKCRRCIAENLLGFYSTVSEKGPGNPWDTKAQAQAKGDFRQGEIFLSVNSLDLIVLPALIGFFYFCRGHSFLTMIIPASRRVLPHWNSRYWSRQQLQCFLNIPASPRAFLISFLIIQASLRVRHSQQQAHPTLITAHCYP